MPSTPSLITDEQRRAVVRGWHRARRTMSQADYCAEVLKRHGIATSPRTLRAWVSRLDVAEEPAAEARATVVRALATLRAVVREVEELDRDLAAFGEGERAAEAPEDVPSPVRSAAVPASTRHGDSPAEVANGVASPGNRRVAQDPVRIRPVYAPEAADSPAMVNPVTVPATPDAAPPRRRFSFE